MNGGRIQELIVIVHDLEKKSSGERERERERESVEGMIHIRRCVEQVFNSSEISEPGRHEFEVGVAPAFEEVEGQQVQVD